MNTEELINLLLNPKTTISRCKKLRYVDAEVAKQAAELIQQLSKVDTKSSILHAARQCGKTQTRLPLQQRLGEQ